MAAPSTPLTPGTYCPASASDLRSPCPFVNTIANHGYVPRDGRNVLASDFTGAMAKLGISLGIRAMFTNAIMNEHVDPKAPTPAAKRSIFARIWQVLRDPWTLVASLGVRRPGQLDNMGRKCLNLDQLGLHDAIEHDVSLTRRDVAQGDNISPQPDLIQALLDSSSDGETLTMQDLLAFRKRRIEQQKRDNPSVNYDTKAHQLGCGEITLILNFLGDGKSVPVDRVRALFVEERLPLQEGWKPRPIGFIYFLLAVERVKNVFKSL